MIFDTDILSMLGKIGITDLLRKLFPEVSLLITFEVYNELLRAKEAGYDFVDDVLEQGFKVIHLDSELINEYEQKKPKLRNIHAGELTSILLCKRDGIAFATNDGKAKRFCEENSVEWLDIVDILRLCYRKRVLDKREIENVIRDIEEKDRTRITRKGEIFADAV
jgi:predicted nucleic acid-binding protein